MEEKIEKSAQIPFMERANAVLKFATEQDVHFGVELSIVDGRIVSRVSVLDGAEPTKVLI